MNLENICYIVGAASLDGVRLSSRPGDYVIAADGGYRTLKARGIEPDFVMGDFDSLGYRPDHPNVETHPVMKDDTDLGLAVRWALAHGYRRLVMAGALGGRLDQTIASLQTLRGLTDAGAQGWLIGCGWVQSDESGNLYSLGIKALIAGTSYIDADPYARTPQQSACTYCEFASACHFENGCGSDRMEYIKATKNDEFWQYIDEVNGEGAHENG